MDSFPPRALESKAGNGKSLHAHVDGLDKRVPLVHPRAQPEEPHGESAYGNNNVSDRRIVLGEQIRGLC
jgi:hypothetical protein